MINCTVVNQNLSLSYDGVVSDSVKYLKIHFNFSEEWDGYSKTVLFRNCDDDETYSVLLSSGNPLYIDDNTCYVPHEVIQSPGFFVSIFGVHEDSVITADEKVISVTKSGYKRGEIPEDPTPTIYEQILEELERNSIQKTGIALDAGVDVVVNRIYQCVSEYESETSTIDKDDTFRVGFFYKYLGDHHYSMVLVQGYSAPIDQTYDPTSEKAQSGKAVAQAIAESNINLENAEGTNSLQQKIDVEGGQPLALGKWSFAEGRGNNFTCTLADIPAQDDGYMLHVIPSEASNFFYYRPTNPYGEGINDNKSYRMSLDWENINNAPFGNDSFAIYVYEDNWKRVDGLTTSYSVSSYPIEHGRHYDIRFTTINSLYGMREIIFAFGDINNRLSGISFRTANWEFYSIDENGVETKTNYTPVFGTTTFRSGTSDTAMDNYLKSYTGTDRGKIWRKHRIQNCSQYKEIPQNFFYGNNVIRVSGDRVSEIRQNAVVWLPDNTEGHGGYYYVENSTKSNPNTLTLDADLRPEYDGDGVLVYTHYISNCPLSSEVKVFSGAALSSNSHTEGNFNTAVWLHSPTLKNEPNVQRQHAEGSRNLAAGYAATVSGEYNQAIGNQTDVGGSHNVAKWNYQTVRGYYNDNKEGNLFEVGNGDTTNGRSNAFEICSDGSGKIKTQGTDPDSLVQKEYVDNLVSTAIEHILSALGGDNGS